MLSPFEETMEVQNVLEVAVSVQVLKVHVNVKQDLYETFYLSSRRCFFSITAPYYH